MLSINVQEKVYICLTNICIDAAFLNRLVTGCLHMQTICSSMLAAMRGVLLPPFISLKGQHLICVVHLVLLCVVSSKVCEHLLCSHVGGVPCHISQGHTPRCTAHVLILIHWVGEGMFGPAKQSGNTTAVSLQRAILYM